MNLNQLNRMGSYIKSQRKKCGYSQKELAEKLNISFQAVSKWETGESYPDISIIVELAELLETSTDKLLTGGEILMNKYKPISVLEIKEALNHLRQMKQVFGNHSAIYQGIKKGINDALSINIEKYLNDALKFEVLLSEIIIQYILEGYIVDSKEVEAYVQSSALKKQINRYLNPSTDINQITISEAPELFKKIHQFHDDLKEVDRLSEIPGEFITLEPGKTYFGTEVQINDNLCYGVAVDESKLYIFSYGKQGTNHKKIFEGPIKKL